jgi:uncharacterized phosphosugar-binding protein
MLTEEFLEQVTTRVEKVIETQGPAIEAAARLILETLKRGHRTFLFGSGHSNLLTEEMVYRAGEVAIYTPILVGGLLPTDYPYHRGAFMERTSGIAASVLDSIPVQEGDTIIVISNSGRNHVPVEMALGARQRGLKVIALTSVEFSAQVPSRHPSGKKLYELADIVLDSCAPHGDASVAVPGARAKIGPLSTILGATILHALSCKICDLVLAMGLTPAVCLSANVAEAETRPIKIAESLEEFTGRVTRVEQR